MGIRPVPTSIRMATDADQGASMRDQVASDRDQRAADRDQVASDNAQDEGDGSEEAGYARSRRARSQSTLERDMTSQARSQTARIRDATADRRDRMAEERDAAARARDELAATLDVELERLEAEDPLDDGELSPGMDLLRRALADRKRAALSRARAAAHRNAAARERDLAAQDRAQAALDRRAAAEELAVEGVDHLTGALRRRVGLAAVQREIERTRRSHEALVLTFIDVNGLKEVNDTRGHTAGDALLRAVARAIEQHLRPYDVVLRFGGDEFVCSLSGQDTAGARERFELISTRLADAADGATITVGFADLRAEDSLDDLVRRADAAMIEARRREEQ